MLAKYLDRFLDIMLAPFAAIGVASMVAVSRLQSRLRICAWIFDKAGVYPIRHHYYSPLVYRSDLKHPLHAQRTICGLDLNEPGQLELLSHFHYREELEAIPLTSASQLSYGYDNKNFGSGDAEYLYSMIRHFKPKKLLEVGSGGSTLVAQLAIRANENNDPSYICQQICVEPYEQPWLERLGVTVHRSRIEDMPLHVVDGLDANDIFFIDSSHVVRPQSDVVHEYLALLGRLKSGVVVHAHDIFTPSDYPAAWVLDSRKLWTEQYLLEAFLCFNREFEVIGALNWLWHNHRDRVAAVCPILASQPGREPGSFWFRRK
jgi:hypothetical protein